jgi:hypothetical protein
VGGLAFQDPLVEVDIQTVVPSIKMVSSSDPFVSSIARAELWSSARFAARDNPSPSLTRDFLSGSMRGNFHPSHAIYQTHSLWTRTRSACRRLNITLAVPDNDEPVISTETSAPAMLKLCVLSYTSLLKNVLPTNYSISQDQGKAA